MNRIKKTVVCLSLCMVMLLGSSLTSFAASGSTYSYANLNLTWTTTSKSTSATLRSGSSNVHMVVGIEGYFYTPYKTVVRKTNSNTSDCKASVSCSIGYKTANNGVTEAYGERNWSQYVYTTVYY